MLPDRHVFVCVHGKACAERNSAEVYARFRACLKASGMKPAVMVTGCGSIGFCDRGVAVAIYPEAVWYSRVTPSDVDEIFDQHVRAGQIVSRLQDELTAEGSEGGVLPAPFTGPHDPQRDCDT